MGLTGAGGRGGNLDKMSAGGKGGNLGKMPKNCLKITKSAFLSQKSGGPWEASQFFRQWGDSEHCFHVKTVVKSNF